MVGNAVIGQATDVALRARVLADLPPYLYPKRKAVELTGVDGGAIAASLYVVRVIFNPKALS